MQDNLDWIQRVRLTAAEPSNWLNMARILRQAAEDVWTSGNLHEKLPDTSYDTTLLMSYTTEGFIAPETGGITRDICFMLFGYALEDLAKGIIYCRDPSLIKKDKMELAAKQGHDLAALFENAGIPLTAEQIVVLKRTTRLIVWKAKYPSPLYYSDTDYTDRMNGYIAFDPIWPPDEYKILSDFYEHSKKELIATMNSVPPLNSNFQF